MRGELLLFAEGSRMGMLVWEGVVCQFEEVAELSGDPYN